MAVTTRFSYNTMTILDDVPEHAELHIRSFEAARSQVSALWRDIRSTTTMIVTGLADRNMKIEIDVDAIAGSGRVILW